MYAEERKKRGKSVIYEVLWSFQPFFIFSLLPLQASRLTFKGLGRDIEKSWQKFRSTQIQTGGKYQLESCVSCFSSPTRACISEKQEHMSLSGYSPQVSATHATRHTQTLFPELIIQ